MRSAWIITQREYLQRVRTRAFVISTVLAPVVLAALLVIPGLMGGRGGEGEREIVVLDRTTVLAQGVTVRLQESGFRVDVVVPGSPEETALEARLRSGAIGGVLELDGATLSAGAAIWRGQAAPVLLRRIAIQQAVIRTALEARLGQADSPGDVRALLDGGSLEIRRLAPDVAEVDRAAGIVAASAGAFLLYVVLLIYGTMLLRAVLEEKTGRIAEILVSTVRPWELMLGKIVGVGAVGLTQLSVWLVGGALIVGAGLPALLPFLPELDLPGPVSELLPSPALVGYFLLSFLLGYFLYASLFAAVGAMCSTEEQAQQLQLPVVMLVVLPIVFLFPIVEDPASRLAAGLSLFPFFSPILMFARVAVGGASAWEALLAIVLMLGALLATAWVAGRIYRVGILMQGKRPTPSELLRWIRQPG